MYSSQVWLNDICRHPSFPHLIPQKRVTASPAAPQWVLRYHQLVSPSSRSEVLPTAGWSSHCCEWGKHSRSILKWSLSASYYHVSHIQLFPFAVLCFMSFFSLSSVFTVLWIVMWLPSIGEPWELAGDEWLACKRGFWWWFFPLLLLLLLLENNLGQPSDEKKLFFCQLLPSASVRLFKALWEVVWRKVASKQHSELHLFPPYQKNQKVPSPLFYPDLT